jgi:hypothetical protein
MKQYLTFVLAILFIVSCDNNDDNDKQLVHGKWNLTKIINMSVGGSASPDANNTHYYQINNDGTFKRIAIENDTSEELEGTYVLTDESVYYGNEDDSIQKFIELSYASEVTFFSCGILSGDKQLLILTSENKLQNNLGGSCDGEDYKYTKQN